MSETTALVPFADIREMANVMGKNKMFGKSPEDLLPLMLIAQAEGKHPAIAAQEYDIIQGRPAINARSALARFQAAGGRIQWVERTDRRAAAIFYHPAGTGPDGLMIDWTWERATKAGLTTKPTWRSFPAQMLASRVEAEGVRAVYPACLSSLYTTEEVADMPPLPRVAKPAKAPEPRDITGEAEAQIVEDQVPAPEATASPEPAKAEEPKAPPEKPAMECLLETMMAQIGGAPAFDEKEKDKYRKRLALTKKDDETELRKIADDALRVLKAKEAAYQKDLGDAPEFVDDIPDLPADKPAQESVGLF